MGGLSQLKLTCVACVLATVAVASYGKVLYTELPPEPDVRCLNKGARDGQLLRKNDCNVISSDDSGTAGLRPDGRCMDCGDSQNNLLDDCSADTAAFTFVRGDSRVCACNVGFYGAQSASGCRKCPAGYTTAGYGATSLSDCNICATGFTRRDGKCVSCSSLFKGSITTAGPGNKNACVCPKGFTGTPGRCRACVGYEVTTASPGAQTCICPAGGRPPFCIPCKGGVVLGDKCVCPIGKSGVWPKCENCPRPWQYRVTTLKPGNNQQCVCSLSATVEDTPQRYFVQRSAKDGSCTCRENNGFFLKAVPNLVWNSEWSTGPCERPDPDFDKFTKLIKYDGRNRLGCDAKAGYGASLAAVVFTEGGSGPLCTKCSGNAYIDTKTTKCFCKAGFGVNPLFGLLDDKNVQLSPPFNAGYCIRCNHPSLTIGTLPYTKRNDTFCRCNWEKGYYGSPDFFSFEGVCNRCPDSRMFVDTQTGVCKCKEGFFKSQDGNKCVENPDCKEGELVNEDGQCICPLVKQADKQCVFPGNVCSKVKLSYWLNVKASDAKFPFSSTLLQAPKVDYLERGWSAINTTTNLVDLSPAIKKSDKNVAVEVNGCLCSREIAENVVEMTSIGSAMLRANVEGDNLVIIDQTRFHTSSSTSYASVESGRYDRCTTFTIFYYSGNTNGVLKLRTVPFDFPEPREN